MKNDKLWAKNSRVRNVSTATKPVINKTSHRNMSPKRKIGLSMDIAPSKSIKRFMPHIASKQISKPNVPKQQSNLDSVKKHPLIAKIETKRLTELRRPTKLVGKSAAVIKQEAITKALETPKPQPEKPVKKGLFHRYRKHINITGIGIAVLILLGYLLYLNMPVISVHIASMQAGIDAKYPEYHPDGYSLSGPVSYSDGEVVMSFGSNTNNSQFTIKQSRSTWDSSAVKSKVEKDSKGEFITTEERGLTIFTYAGNAAWVNGGVLYTITGNAPLSSDQIRRMATSL
jgi:hypothetical protein